MSETGPPNYGQTNFYRLATTEGDAHDPASAAGLQIPTGLRYMVHLLLTPPSFFSNPPPIELARRAEHTLGSPIRECYTVRQGGNGRATILSLLGAIGKVAAKLHESESEYERERQALVCTEPSGAAPRLVVKQSLCLIVTPLAETT